jgi:hypothetical protein
MAKCRGGACALRNLAKQNAAVPAQITPQNNPQAAQQLATQNLPAIQQLAYSLGQRSPQQYGIQNSQGPMTGLIPQQNNGFQQQKPRIPIPQPNQQNTVIPQGQVLHRSGKQRGKFGRIVLGSRPEVFNTPNFTPYQTEALNYLLQYGLGGLEDIDNNQFDFGPIENQELERFYTQTIPSLAERFTAMGGQGGQRSSAFQGALGNAGRFLGNDLASQQQQYNLQQQGRDQNLITNLLSFGLSPQFSANLNQGKKGALPWIANAGSQLAKAGISAAMMV